MVSKVWKYMLMAVFCALALCVLCSCDGKEEERRGALEAELRITGVTLYCDGLPYITLASDDDLAAFKEFFIGWKPLVRVTNGSRAGGAYMYDELMDMKCVKVAFEGPGELLVNERVSGSGSFCRGCDTLLIGGDAIMAAKLSDRDGAGDDYGLAYLIDSAKELTEFIEKMYPNGNLPVAEPSPLPDYDLPEHAQCAVPGVPLDELEPFLQAESFTVIYADGENCVFADSRRVYFYDFVRGRLAALYDVFKPFEDLPFDLGYYSWNGLTVFADAEGNVYCGVSAQPSEAGGATEPGFYDVTKTP